MRQAIFFLAALALGSHGLDLRTEVKPTGDRFQGCIFEIAMLEKQPLGTTFNKKNYWTMNAVINKAYADRWGYAFTLAAPEAQQPRDGRSPANSWYRVPFLHERMQAADSRREKCGWILYMDSSAYFRDHSVPLSKYLDGLFKDQPLHPRTGGIFQWDAKNTGLVNDRIFLVQVNGHGEDLMNAWRQSGEEDEAIRFEAAEAGTLTELLFPGKAATRSGQALKLMQVSHAKTVGGERVRGHVTVLPAQADAKGDQRWGDLIQDTSALSPGLKRSSSAQMLKDLNLLERFDAVLGDLAVQKWQPPLWAPGKPKQGSLTAKELRKAKARASLAPVMGKAAGLLAEKAQKAALNDTTITPEVAALARIQDDDLSEEEEEIKQELGEFLL